MAFIVPFIVGAGAAAAATAVGAGAVTAAAVGVGAGVATSSLMNKKSSSTPIAPTAMPGSSATTISDVTASQANVAAKADTTKEAAIAPTTAAPGSAAEGAAEAAVARQTSTGPAETAAIDYMEKGRRSTILTRAPGLLTEQAQAGTFRQRRTLVGEGLIT